MGRFILFFALLFCTALQSVSASVPFVDSRPTSGMYSYHTRLVTDLLQKKIVPVSYAYLQVFLTEDQIEPRGSLRGRTISLSPYINSDSEFLKLFFHELAHFIDIYGLRSTETQIDPSVLFYDISWSDVTVKKSGQSVKDFISGYAATNRYEDFAESFVFYIFHNDTFFDRAMRNDVLRQKYLFFQDILFSTGRFTGTDFGINTVPSYLWDTTKVPVSFKKYLYFLESSVY